MPLYKVQAPDGKVITIEGPAGATQAQVIAAAQKLYKPTSKRNPLDAFMRGASAGATMNFGDEIASAANAVVPLDRLGGFDVKSMFDKGGGGFKGAYNANMDLERQTTEYDKKHHAFARGAGELTGTVLGTLALSRIPGFNAVAAKVPGGLVTKAAVGGGVQGALSGAGAGDTAASRAQGAKAGGATGAVLGGALGAGVKVTAPIVRKYWQVFAGKGVTQQALAQITNALKKDGYDVTSPEGLKALGAELRRYMQGGKPVALADIGAATRARTGVGLRTPSGAQQQAIDVVMDRKGGQGPRLSADVKKYVAPRTDIHALDDDLVAQRAEVALPLRKAAMETGGPSTVTAAEASTALPSAGPGTAVARVVDDPILQNLARLPYGQDALEGARKLAAQEKALLDVQGKDSSHLPTFPARGEPLDMKALDYMKRHLDTQVDAAYRSGDSAVRATAPQLQAYRDAIRNRMRTAVPEYGQYLDAYSDATTRRQALAAGRGGPDPQGRGTYPGFARTDPEVIAAEQAARPQDAQELYRVGAARNLDDTINNTNLRGSPADRILKTPNEIRRLEATGVPAADAQALNSSVQQERQLNLLPAELSGAQTDARLAARHEADSGINASTPLNPARSVSWLAFLARKASGAADLARNAKVNEAALPRLLAQDPAAITKTVEELIAAGNKELAAKLRREAIAKYGARIMGSLIGAPVTHQERAQ